MSYFEAGASKVDTVSQLDLCLLLANLKKACGLWFLTERNQPNSNVADSNALAYILSTVVEIVQHGMRLLAETKSPRSIEDANSTVKSTVITQEALQKLSDDFEWVRRSAQIRDSFADTIDTSPAASVATSSVAVSHRQPQSVEQFLRAWVLRNLRSNCLCACLQVLVADRELLALYYSESAFLCSEPYSTALFICLSAVELNQYSLLSQIEAELYGPRLTGTLATDNRVSNKHRRTSSHPIFSISPPKRPFLQTQKSVPYENDRMKQEVTVVDSDESNVNKNVLSHTATTTDMFTFRKTRSLPVLDNKFIKIEHRRRPRSKTMYVANKAAVDAMALTAKTLPRGIPKVRAIQSSTSSIGIIISASSSLNTNSSYSGSDSINTQPSTSTNSQQSQRTNLPYSNSPTPSSSTVTSSTASTTTARRIELINCDDIKIWTDQSQAARQPQVQGAQISEPFAIPQNAFPQKQKTKSVSPIGSFLCNLFSTPPTYTHWSTTHQTSNTHQSSDDHESVTVYPCNTHTELSSSAGVLDVFRPVCGMKLRSRNSQNLFEDGISSLDYSAVANNASDNSTEALETTVQLPNNRSPMPKSHQNLSDFLQMSRLSRNNTELEKENAHFHISEAIISAIEHMKWANRESGKKWRRRKSESSTATTPATDWLAGESHASNAVEPDTESIRNDSNEHIPYAEVGESCLDLLSAEVVGLSLISKFNDEHLPKVSELKWLVSDDATPQQLLPMPDNSPTANPDDNIIPPMTRGTKYWAPPRQQIIFTDHPPPNRRELIQKQNNRCAGCGMRVSPQYLHSFRYCTYLGKYHCTGCHRNQISPIPAKILHMWDFKCYPVSGFAYRLLEQMYTYPLFYVPDLNAALYIRSKALFVARKKRMQLKFVKDFIKTCRFAVREQIYFDSIPHHITSDPDIWSISDFIDVNNKSMQHSIDELIEKCEHHIFNCVLCTARGFICEYCNKDQVIYPWEPKIVRCDRCGACFHQNCWKSMLETCCRCQRINKRQDEIAEL